MRRSLKLWLLVMIFMSCVQGYEQLELRAFEFDKLTKHSDKAVSTGTLWSTTVPSVLVCSIICDKDALCISFFYDGDTCSGYSKPIPNQLYTVTQIGQRFYRTSKWCRGNTSVLDEETGSCFTLITTPTFWDDAKTSCQSLGAELAVADTDRILDLLSKIISYLCPKGVFVPYVNSCYWTTNTTLLWDNSSMLCNNSGGHLATFPDNATHIQVLTETGIYPGNENYWVGVQDFQNCVFLNYDNSPLLWDNVVHGCFATRACLMVDIQLASLMWVEKKCYLDVNKAICEKSIFDEVWIGASDTATENQWKWINGNSLNTSKWIPGQPDGGTTENCAVLKFQYLHTAIADAKCGDVKHFICKKDK